MKEKKRDKLFKWFQNCKCKWSKYLYVLRGLAFHGPYFFFWLVWSVYRQIYRSNFFWRLDVC